MGSGEVQHNLKTSEHVYFREVINFGGGMDMLNSDFTRDPRRLKALKNMILTEKGALKGRNPYTYGIDSNAITVGAGEPARVIAEIPYRRLHDGRYMFIVIADNNVAGANYKVSVFYKEWAGGLNNITYGGTYLSGAAGYNRDTYWDSCQFFEPKTERHGLILCGGQNVFKYAPDAASLPAGSAMELLAYPPGSSTTDADEWKRPLVNDSIDWVNVSLQATGYLEGNYYYKALWMKTTANGEIRSPASEMFPLYGTVNGIKATKDSILVGYNVWAPPYLHYLPRSTSYSLELYRTEGNGLTFYHLVTLDPWLGGSNTYYYIDNIPDEDLGWEIPNVGDPPASGFLRCTNWQGRLWLFARNTGAGSYPLLNTGKYMNQVVYSDIGYPESFRDFANYYLINNMGPERDPGEAIKERGKSLIGFCKDSVHELKGYDPTGLGTFEIVTKHRTIGCSSFRTIQEDEDGNWYWFYEKWIVKFDGYSVKRVCELSDRILNFVKLKAMHHACAVIDKKNGYYILFYPKDQTTYNDKCLVYEYRTGECFEFDNMYFSSAVSMQLPTGTEMERVFAGEGREGTGGYIYRLDQLTTNMTDRNIDDAANTIDCIIGTDLLDEGYPDIQKIYSKLIIICETMPTAATSKFDVKAWMNGNEGTADFERDNVATDPATRAKGIREVILAKTGAHLRGNMIQFQIQHKQKGNRPKIYKAILYGLMKRTDSEKLYK